MNFGTLSTFDRGTKDDILYDLWTTVHQVLLIIWIWFNAPVSVATTSCSRFATFSIYSRKLHVWNILWEELLSGITNWQNYNQMQAYECISVTLCHFNPKVPWLKIEGHQAESLAGCSLSNPRKARNVWWCNQWENSVDLLQCPHRPHAH